MSVAAFVTAKQLLTFSFVLAVLVHVTDRKAAALRWFLFSVLATLAAALCVLGFAPSHRISTVFIHWNESVVVGLLIGLVVLHHVRGHETALLRNAAEPMAYPAVVTSSLTWAALPPLYFFPDWGGSAAFLRETAVLQGTSRVAAGVALGVLIALALTVLGRWAVRKVPPGWRWFGAPQLLLFLAGLKLATGGIHGYAEYSMIPSLQRIFMKLSHDVVHHLFTIVLVPDHPLLKVSTWNFIGYFFGSNFGLMVTLVALLLPPGVLLFSVLRAPIVYPSDLATGAERRLYRSRTRYDRLRRSTVVWLFVALVLGAWFVRSGEKISAVYDPEPRPVVSDKGVIVIPRKDPTMDLSDGRIYKFSYLSGTRTLRILVAARPDGRLAVCLDACEICPPEGYGQEGNHVTCLFCNTPIPTDTLGTPGGCNPIPLKADISDRDIRVPVQELESRWNEVNSGKTRLEAVP